MFIYFLRQYQEITDVSSATNNETGMILPTTTVRFCDKLKGIDYHIYVLQQTADV